MNGTAISLAFSKYNLGKIVGDPTPIKGDVDLNYKISTDDNRAYFLKHIVNKQNVEQFEFLGSLHEILREHDIPVPKIYKTNRDKYVEDFCILYEFIDGERKVDWTKEEIISLVQNFARMHKVLKEVSVPEFIKKKNDKYIKGGGIEFCHSVFKPQIQQLPIASDLKDFISFLIDLLYGKLSEFERLPKFLIHGDLNEMNALFKDNQNVGIVDFGISYDPFVYDLGEFCYWFCFHFGMEEFNKERYELIVKTYEEVNPLSQVEKDLLPYMVLRRHMMDIMLLLQWYWDNEDSKNMPLDSLVKKNIRTQKILNSFGL